MDREQEQEYRGCIWLYDRGKLQDETPRITHMFAFKKKRYTDLFAAPGSDDT